jgi:hypothetical protein
MEGSVLNVERILSRITSIVHLVSQRILIMSTKKRIEGGGGLKKKQPDRPTMRRGKCPRFPDAQVFKDYCQKCGRCDGKRMD